MISLRHVRVFLAVAEHGSTAAAARRLHVSQPAVSVAIKELEALLGQPLFQRQPARGLVATAFALEKLPQARALAAGFAAFAAAGPGGEPAGEVSFGYYTALGPKYIPGVLHRMARRYPRVTITPVEADLEELDRLIDSGRVEVALAYHVRTGVHTIFERIAELPPYAVVPARHPLARRKSVSVKDLASEPFILVDLPYSRDFLLSVFRSEGIEPRISYRARSPEMVVGMVANGLGVSVLVTRAASDRSYDGKRVVRLPIAHSRIRQSVVLAWPSRSVPTAPARALADCIRAYVGASV
jgi:DNA-binding transcriptional LysR family regulator